MTPSYARTLSALERSTVAAAKGHNFFCYLMVTDADGAWFNVGALATGGGRKANFFNSATLTDGIDQNTLTFSAVLARNVGNWSLSPYRTDSPLNVRAGGAFAPRLELRRSWRLMACVMPRGVRPGPGSYRPMAEGRLTRIDVQDEPATITVQGRGSEIDLIDSYVMVKTRTYGNTAAPVAVETVIQKMIDDQTGAGVYPVTAPEAPIGLYMPEWSLTEGPLMPAVLSTAALAAQVVRYRYDSADVNRLLQFSPPRNATVADYEINNREWKARPVTSIDIQGVRNFLKATYPDAALGTIETVYSPSAEPTTVTVAGGVATFSASPGAALANDATIVINDVGYKVSGYTVGGATATLAGAPDVTAAKWYTSASITKYGVRPMLIDLTAKEQMTNQTSVGNYLDALRSDMEDPSLEQSIVVKGWWFIQLHDYLKLLPDGKTQNEVVFGGVTGFTHSFANGMLDTTIALRGKPSGGFRRWLSLGSGAPRTPLLPDIAGATLAFIDSPEYVISPPQISVTFTYGDRCRSAFLEIFTDEALTVPWATAAPGVARDRALTGDTSISTFGLTSDAERNKTYWVRITPYSGPQVTGIGLTGITGIPWIGPIYAGNRFAPQANLDLLSGTVDTINDDLTALAEEPFVTFDDTLGLPNARKLSPGATTSLDLATPGVVKVEVSQEALQDAIAAFISAGANITLTYNDVANTFTIAASGGGGGAAATVSVTTASLADGATQTGTLAIAKSGFVQKVVASAACWIRLYETAAARTADAGRLITTSPKAGQGILSNVAPGLDSAGLTVPITPAHEVHNGDTPRTTTIYYSITNKSGAAAAIAATLTYLSTES